MARELLSYVGLAQRLNITIGAAKGLAKGLHLTRYAAPDGETLLLVDLSRLRAADFGDDIEEDPVRNSRARADDGGDSHEVEFAPRRQRRPNVRRATRAQIVASLHERIEDIQRQLDRVEDGSGDQELEGPDSFLLADLFKIAADARQTAEQTREELAAHRSRRWWKRASA
jgi:hypothetical protein